MKKKINVVLKEKIEQLGEVGETKLVALGYFKNFLLPRGLVVPAGTKEARELIEKREKSEVSKLSETSELPEAPDKSDKRSVKATPTKSRAKPAKIKSKKK